MPRSVKGGLGTRSWPRHAAPSCRPHLPGSPSACTLGRSHGLCCVPKEASRKAICPNWEWGNIYGRWEETDQTDGKHSLRGLPRQSESWNLLLYQQGSVQVVGRWPEAGGVSRWASREQVLEAASVWRPRCCCLASPSSKGSKLKGRTHGTWAACPGLQHGVPGI